MSCPVCSSGNFKKEYSIDIHINRIFMDDTIPKWQGFLIVPFFFLSIAGK